MENKIRIIAGIWRGRKIHFPDLPSLRPTPDRVRETLFNWLAPYIRDSRCLDLFAGSGILGFEALSRGARTVTWVEENAVAADAIADAVRVLVGGGSGSETESGQKETNAPSCQIVTQDVIRWLKEGRNSEEKFCEKVNIKDDKKEIENNEHLDGKIIFYDKKHEMSVSYDNADIRIILQDNLHDKIIPYDIVFLDPPYHKKLLPQCMKLLNENHWVQSGSLLYTENDHPISEADIPSGWQIIKDKKAGNVYYYLIKVS